MPSAWKQRLYKNNTPKANVMGLTCNRFDTGNVNTQKLRYRTWNNAKIANFRTASIATKKTKSPLKN